MIILDTGEFKHSLRINSTCCYYENRCKCQEPFPNLSKLSRWDNERIELKKEKLREEETRSQKMEEISQAFSKGDFPKVISGLMVLGYSEEQSKEILRRTLGLQEKHK